MTRFHDDLTHERWQKMPLMEQLANVGSDIQRTIHWKKLGDFDSSHQAFWRALELIDLTVADPKNSGSARREILRAREALVDHFVYDNIYNTTDEIWQRYFFQFNYAAALQRKR